MPPKAKRLTKKEQQTAIRQQLLKNANDVEDFMVDFQAFTSLRLKDTENSVQLRSLKAENLNSNEREQIEELFRSNMQKMYESSSWGFDMDKKRQELFEDEARYIVVESSNGVIDAFLHFRFTEDSRDPVVYVFEIQVGINLQRHGLGKRLMQLLELIGRKYKMKFILLTVFKENLKAMKFYVNTMNFVVDETSPSMNGDMDESYEILSKSLT